MPLVSSPHWKMSWKLCTKHCTRLPCYECLSTHDPDIKVALTIKDMELFATRPHVAPEDILPPGYCDWMYERMLN